FAPSLAQSAGEGREGLPLLLACDVAMHCPEQRPELPLPSPPLCLRQKGGGRSSSRTKQANLPDPSLLGFAPSLAQSAGEGWGGVLLLLACDVAMHCPKQSPELPLPSPPLHLR